MIIVGFDKEKYNISYLDRLSEKYLYELSQEDGTAVIYENLKDFEWELHHAKEITCYYFFLREENDVIKGMV